MSHPNYPIRINVGFLIYQPIGTYREFNFDLEQIQFDPEPIVKEFNGIAHIDRVQKGLLVQAKFQAKVDTQCVRCLVDYQQPISIAFTEMFVFPKQDKYSSGNSKEDEDELILPDDGYIDLTPIAREYFLLETPLKSICKPDCKGLCAVCGENLNINSCEHQEIVDIED